MAEVTAEMIEAGLRELEAWCALFGHSAPDTVYMRAVYRAMRALEPAPPHDRSNETYKPNPLFDRYPWNAGS